MITNYNEFKKTNEGVIGDFVKKLFKGLVDDIKEDFKKPLEDFTKKASNTTDPKRMKQIVTDYLKSNYETLNKSLEESKTPSDILVTIDDNLKAIYTSISAVNDTIGNFKFEDIFDGINDKNTIKLFTKGAKYFDKYVEPFSKNLIMKFDNEIKKEDLVIPDKKETKKTETEQKQEINNAQSPQGENTQEENTQPEQPQDTQEKDYTKLNKDILRWFDNVIYDNVRKKLDFEKSSNNITQNIENNTLKNKEGINKILNNISNISDSKQMARIRDVLIEMGYDEDYGLF